MAEFINTADVIGDDAVSDQFIMRTIKEYMENRITKVGQYAFYGCTALAKVDVPNATKIETYAFSGCSALKSIDAAGITEIGNYAFQKCVALAEVCFPLVSDRIIYTFPDCTRLAKADFPCVSSIGAETFARCTALTALILRNDKVCTLASTNSFNGTAIANGTGYIYVPKSLVDSYKAATNWSTFAFRALEDYTVDGTVTGALDDYKIYGG